MTPNRSIPLISILLAAVLASGTACGNPGGVDSSDSAGAEITLETVSLHIDGMT